MVLLLRVKVGDMKGQNIQGKFSLHEFYFYLSEPEKFVQIFTIPATIMLYFCRLLAMLGNLPIILVIFASYR